MRIGINVPNELIKRMEPIRDVTNVSQICRDAIQTWVDAYENASDRAKKDGVEEIADRLWHEYSDKSVNWEALGHEDAKLWVQLATLVDFENLFHNLKGLARQGRSADDWIPVYRHLQGAKTFWERQQEHQEWFYWQIELDEKTNHFQQAHRIYNRGWLSYVTSVWQLVKDRVEAYATIQEAAISATRGEVEVPDHLALT